MDGSTELNGVVYVSRLGTVSGGRIGCRMALSTSQLQKELGIVGDASGAGASATTFTIKRLGTAGTFTGKVHVFKHVKQ